MEDKMNELDSLIRQLSKEAVAEPIVESKENKQHRQPLSDVSHTFVKEIIFQWLEINKNYYVEEYIQNYLKNNLEQLVQGSLSKSLTNQDISTMVKEIIIKSLK